MDSDIIVTTGDLKQAYQVLGPVYFQVSNKGLFSSALSKLTKQYEAEIAQMKRQDIDLDTTAFQYFYLQMYGTAVKLL
jgi:hypothetical protein